MVEFVLDDAEIVINSIDLSAFVLSATLTINRDLPEDTTMGDFTTSRLAGVRDWSLEVTFKQDFDSGSVDGTLWGVYNGDAAVIVSMMADKTAGVGGTNPKYSGPAHLETYPAIGGAHGDLAQVSVTFQANGPLSRLVA